MFGNAGLFQKIPCTATVLMWFCSSSLNSRLIFKQAILQQCIKKSKICKKILSSTKVILYFSSAAFQSRKLLSFGLHIEFFCALEIEKKSSRMTTTTSWIFITTLKKIHSVVVVILSDCFSISRAQKNSIFIPESKFLLFKTSSRKIQYHFGRRMYHNSNNSTTLLYHRLSISSLLDRLYS